MEKYTIDQLNGKALENAIDNVINAVRSRGWGWEIDRNREDAYEMANVLKARFDENGNIHPANCRDAECCEIELTDSVPGMTVKAPELPKVEIPEDWDI